MGLFIHVELPVPVLSVWGKANLARVCWAAESDIEVNIIHRKRNDCPIEEQRAAWADELGEGRVVEIFCGSLLSAEMCDCE